MLLRADGRVVAATTAGKLGRYTASLRSAHCGPREARRPVGGNVPARWDARRARPSHSTRSATSRSARSVGPAIAAHGGAYPWAFVGSTLRRADITVGNLETAVSTRGIAAVKEFTFRGPPAALVPMRDVAGFDVLTLANNHTVDFGRDALLDTLKAVHAAGIQTIGAGANDLQARRPAIVEAGVCALRSSATRT